MTEDDYYFDPEGPGEEDLDLIDNETPDPVCQHCNTQLYNTYSKCPECGAWPGNDQPGQKPWVVLTAAILLLLIFWWGYTILAG